jgi:hypothetical protein
MKHDSMSSRDKSAAIANKRFQAAKEGRKYEIDKFWQRSAFFWVFIAASFVAFSKAEGLSRFPFACFGFVSSFAWTLQNRGSKYWYEAWEEKIKRAELDVLGEPLFNRIEAKQSKGLWGAADFSVTKLTIALSDFVTLIWFVLIVQSTDFFEQFRRQHRTGLYAVGIVTTLIYCASLFIYARRTNG